MQYSFLFLTLSVASVASARNPLHVRDYEDLDVDDALLYPRNWEDSFEILQPRSPGQVISKRPPAKVINQDKTPPPQPMQKPANGGTLGHSRLPPNLKGTDREPRRLKTMYTGRMRVPDYPPPRAARGASESPRPRQSRTNIGSASSENGAPGKTTEPAPGKESGNGAGPSKGEPQQDVGPSGTQKMSVKPDDANARYKPPKKNPTKNLDTTRQGFAKYYTPEFMNPRWERPDDKPGNPGRSESPEDPETPSRPRA